MSFVSMKEKSLNVVLLLSQDESLNITPLKKQEGSCSDVENIPPVKTDKKKPTSKRIVVTDSDSQDEV